MRILLFFLPLFIFAKPFKIASYNVENLFDAEKNGFEYRDYTSSHNWTEKMVNIKLNHTAEVLCDLDADIIGLQEIENETVLIQLQKRLKRVGCPYPYRAITSKKGAPIQVALLSRFRIQSERDIVVSRHHDGVRNILEAVVDAEGNPLHLFVNHWKSRSRNGWESKRMKYAKALKKRLDKLPKGTDYIVLGDFNTDYDANLRLNKRINDTGGRTGLHDVLGTVEEESKLTAGKREVHYTLWNELKPDERWSTKYYGKKGTVDHLLLPASMFDAKGIDYVNDSFQVMRENYLFTSRKYMNRWEIKNGKHTGRGYSDHLPIYAWFDVKPYRKNNANLSPPKQEEKTIEYLYTVDVLKHDIVLKEAVVVWRHKDHALVKQRPEGRGVFLYKCARALKSGQKYDLLVRGITKYKGLKEITQVYVLEKKERENAEKYMLGQDDLSKSVSERQNEMLRSITGIYEHGYFYANGRKIPIYFKNRERAPRSGVKLKIDYALLGYYNVLQLVVFEPDDFQVLRKR